MALNKTPTSTFIRREKLIGFNNWAQWASFTKSMLIENDIWDIVEINPQPLQQSASRLWDYKKKKD